MRATGGANWNIVGLTDLGGSVVERYVYTPYGQVSVHQGERDQCGSVNAYGDYDSDQDVDCSVRRSIATSKVSHQER